MKLQYIKAVVLSALLMLFFSCKKDAVIDGGVSNPKVNMTTYDYLKAHPRGLFDTLLLIVDKAGMKELVNSPGTMFVPTDYSIQNYLNLRRAEIRKVDERQDFTLDSLLKNYSPAMLKDSMSVYLFPQTIQREDLEESPKEYASRQSPYKFLVSLLEHGNNDYNADGIITTKPKFMWFSRTIGEKDLEISGRFQDPSGNPDLLDSRSILQTTGIISNTGIIHVLENGHIWLRGFKLNVN